MLLENNYKNTEVLKSEYIGVYNYPKRKKWIAKITYKGKEIVIGFFQYEKAAALAYNQKALELYKEKAILNIVETEWEKKAYTPLEKTCKEIILPALESRDDYYTSDQTEYLKQKHNN